jgi:hypothetical protein
MWFSFKLSNIVDGCQVGNSRFTKFPCEYGKYTELIKIMLYAFDAAEERK